MKVYSIQIEAHGEGSPADAVELARALRIHLWGAKNAQPGWIDRAQARADRQNVPVRFFVANEEYGSWVRVPGFGTYSHTSDVIAPAGADIGPSLANAGVVSWPEFRTRRLDPLQRACGRLVWQFGENEDLVRMYLDDSIERGGYAAISTFHFGNPDFTNSEPFLNRYRGQIPFVALAGRARRGAVVVRRHDDRLPHPFRRLRAILGRLAGGSQTQPGRCGAS